MMRMEKVVVMGAMTTTAGTVALKVYTSLNTKFSFVYRSYQSLGIFFSHCMILYLNEE
jgi:predicted small integral membrane protein